MNSIEVRSVYLSCFSVFALRPHSTQLSDVPSALVFDLKILVKNEKSKKKNTTERTEMWMGNISRVVVFSAISFVINDSSGLPCWEDRGSFRNFLEWTGNWIKKNNFLTLCLSCLRSFGSKIVEGSQLPRYPSAMVSDRCEWGENNSGLVPDPYLASFTIGCVRSSFSFYRKIIFLFVFQFSQYLLRAKEMSNLNKRASIFFIYFSTIYVHLSEFLGVEDLNDWQNASITGGGGLKSFRETFCIFLCVSIASFISR